MTYYSFKTCVLAVAACADQQSALKLSMLLQNNVGAVQDGGTGNVVFQANNQAFITMYLGTTPPNPGNPPSVPTLVPITCCL